MASRSPFLELQRRLYSKNAIDKWSIRQVRNSDFYNSLLDLKTTISDSDFVAVSLQKTGSSSFPWHRVLPFDTPQIAYFKENYAAEKFQILHFALCPFSLKESKLVAHPFNFHLFPRDELNIGMPTYSFACQVSHLTSMAREGFDFDACIYDGISYLSRAQESVAKVRVGCTTFSTSVLKSSPRQSVADSVFIQRVKSRVKNWKDACNSSTKTNDALLSSLRKLIIGGEQYGSRPSLTIDVCSERQVQLVLELLSEFSDVLVPLVIPAKGGGTQAIRAILTSSKEDKVLLEKEVQNLAEEESKRFCGFREVIDMISASKKPIVSYNSLNDFTSIHSKFLSPLPPTIDEFASSLHLVFPHVLDVKHLMSNIGALSKMTSITPALFYLKNHFFAPVDFDIQDKGNERKFHGHNVIKLCHLFVKVCSVLKIDLNGIQSNGKHLAPVLEECANIFNSFSAFHQESMDEDIKIWTNNVRKVSCENLVFLWGFRDGMTARLLKTELEGSHKVFSEDFDVRFIDKKCAVVVFWQAGLSETLLGAMNSDGIIGSLKEMVAEGLRAADYETYKRVFRLGLWEAELADSLEKALSEPNVTLEDDCETRRLGFYPSNDFLINLNDL